MEPTYIRNRFKGAWAGTVILGAVLLGNMTPATAATGVQSIIVIGINDRLTAVATGPVAGLASVTPIDEYSDLISFSNGTLRLHHPQTGGDFQLDPTTCFAVATFTGDYTVSDGTGAYVGVSGSGTYSGRGVFGFGRGADGTCSEEEEVFRFFTVKNSGTTSLH